MNKKIDELSEQAFAPINDIASEGIADRHTFNQAWFKLYSQNLAELVIKECIDSIEIYTDYSDDYNKGLAKAKEMIEDKFNIK